MDKREEIFLNEALKYKKLYEEATWWKFKERRILKKYWKSSLDNMVRYGTLTK